MAALFIFEVFCRALMSDTASPRTKFIRARDMLYRKITKKILAMTERVGFGALMKLAVKSYSPISMVWILMRESNKLVKAGELDRRM